MTTSCESVSEDSFPLEHCNVAAYEDDKAEEEANVLAAGADLAVVLQQVCHLTVASV